MSGFAKCVIWLIVLALLAHPLGQALPRRWFDGERFPYRCCKWEKQGRIYTRIGVERWKALVPDMSRLLPALMPAKKLTEETFADLPRMIQETCVAELIHVLLSVTGLACLAIWPGVGGAVVTAVYILLGNLPFIIIQRYNRPRLQRLLALQQRKQERKVTHGHADTELQYGRGA